MQRVLAIWLPNWPIQRRLTTTPELRGQALLLEATNHRGQFIAACSAEAQAAGVHPGLPTSEAKELILKNPALTPAPSLTRISLLPHDPAADRTALQKLAQWCHRFTPTAGVEEADAPDTLILDATNLAPLYGSEQHFAAQVLFGLRRLGLKAHAGLGPSIGAAWALAHYASREDEALWEGEAPAEPRSGYTPQRLGRSLALPTTVPSDETAAAIAPLPIAALRLPADLLETLATLGADRIGDLIALPREQLRSRFGPVLLTRIDQVRGAASETFAAVDPPEDFVVEQLFEYPVAHRESLHHVLETLLERLAWMLAQRCAGALRVACRFECEATAAAELEVGLFQPTANPRHLLEILDLEFERLRLRAPATAVSIRVVRHAPLTERQGALFDPERNLESSQALTTLVNRLASRLGDRAVLRCRLTPDPQPERAYKREPLISDSPPLKGGARGGIAPTRNRPLTKKRTQKRPSPNLSPQGRGTDTLAPLDRPLHLLRRPAPLETLSSVIPDGPPIQFRRAGQLHVIARSWGPERIETGWWRGQSAWRDYYRIETTAGCRYWLYRRRHDGRWFLHGLFG